MMTSGVSFAGPEKIRLQAGKGSEQARLRRYLPDAPGNETLAKNRGAP
jgi:hypothetical protein